eukprot:Platyproteum_vivax@DN3791_c0_g1_i2.p1
MWWVLLLRPGLSTVRNPIPWRTAVAYLQSCGTNDDPQNCSTANSNLQSSLKTNWVQNEIQSPIMRSPQGAWRLRIRGSVPGKLKLDILKDDSYLACNTGLGQKIKSKSDQGRLIL